jgi:TrmH family RNA methyltransferase
MLISSASNPRLKELRSRFQGGYPDAQGRIRIEGPKLLREAIQSHFPVEEVFVSVSCRRDPDIQVLLGQIPGKPAVIEVIDRLFPSIAGTGNPQGLLALAKVPSVSLEKLLLSASFLLVGCELQDPGNLGTLLRSAEAFGVEGLLLTQTSVNPWNEKVIRGSAGSIFRVPCLSGFESLELLHNLERHGFRFLAATPKSGIDFREADFQGRFALMLGNEGKGLREEVLARIQTRIRIPMTQAIESLNVAVAASIILCEAARQRSESGGRSVHLKLL